MRIAKVPEVASKPAPAVGGAREYGVDELARQAGTTVRNVRAYQDRGLLPPPERRGRVGVYTEAHLARLRIIGQLLARGYTLANIAELLEAWERGHDLSQLLGLESAVASPWSDEAPSLLSMAELTDMFGPYLSP
ncbi:MAG: MerR family transcriptional regulator, partial [Hydrocarboniphaga effusa]|nr:MerR family transcriptional regulator [Hydrocarboniphaga effusa]